MKIAWFAIVLVSICTHGLSISLYADNTSLYIPLFDKNTIREDTKEKTIVSKSLIADINQDLKDYVMASVPQQLSLSIDLVDGKQIQTTLELALISDGGLRVIEAESNRSISPPKILCYRGKVEGNTHSIVALTFSYSQISGVVSDLSGNYAIGKYSRMNNGNTCIVYQEKELTIPHSFNCSVVEIDSLRNRENNMSKDKKGDQLQNGSCRALKIDFYCDFGLYQEFDSNSEDVIEYVVGLFNVVGYIYALESVHMLIGNILIFTTNDPFSNTSTADALNQLRNYISPNGYNGNLVHLLSGGSLSGGRAYLGPNLCDKNEFACGVNFVWGNIEGGYGNIPLFVRDIKVVAHELGHNLNSAHTHSYNAWGCQQIDNCQDNSDPGMSDDDKHCPWYCQPTCLDGPMPSTNGGTIMSYCDRTGLPGISLANGFGPLPGNKIRARYNAAWDCLEEYPLDWRTQNYTHGSPTFQYYGRFIFAGNNVLNNHPQGPVIINFSSGSTTWQTGRAIYLKAGFRKTNTGTFNARILPMLNCFNQYSMVASGEQDQNFEDNQSTHVTASTLTRVGFYHSYTSDGIYLSPNPANTEIAVVGKDISTVEIYTSLGLLVLSVNSEYSSINISQLAQGTYYVRCTTSQGVIVKPFVIVR
jgi:hypothetical protein